MDKKAVLFLTQTSALRLMGPVLPLVFSIFDFREDLLYAAAEFGMVVPMIAGMNSFGALTRLSAISRRFTAIGCTKRIRATVSFFIITHVTLVFCSSFWFQSLTTAVYFSSVALFISYANLLILGAYLGVTPAATAASQLIFLTTLVLFPFFIMWLDISMFPVSAVAVSFCITVKVASAADLSRLLKPLETALSGLKNNFMYFSLGIVSPVSIFMTSEIVKASLGGHVFVEYSTQYGIFAILVFLANVAAQRSLIDYSSITDNAHPLKTLASGSIFPICTVILSYALVGVLGRFANLGVGVGDMPRGPLEWVFISAVCFVPCTLCTQMLLATGRKISVLALNLTWMLLCIGLVFFAGSLEAVWKSYALSYLVVAALQVIVFKTDLKKLLLAKIVK